MIFGSDYLPKKPRSKSEAGQTIVEFTFILVLFLLFTFIIVEGGRLIFDYNTVSHAAREGVRYAIVRGSSSTCGSGCPASASDIDAFVRSQSPGVNLTAVNVCWWKTAPNCAVDPHNSANKGPGSTVRVTARYDFTPFVPFIPSGMISLASTAQMVISQ